MSHELGFPYPNPKLALQQNRHLTMTSPSHNKFMMYLPLSDSPSKMTFFTTLTTRIIVMWWLQISLNFGFLFVSHIVDLVFNFLWSCLSLLSACTHAKSCFPCPLWLTLTPHQALFIYCVISNLSTICMRSTRFSGN